MPWATLAVQAATPSVTHMLAALRPEQGTPFAAVSAPTSLSRSPCRGTAARTYTWPRRSGSIRCDHVGALSSSTAVSRPRWGCRLYLSFPGRNGCILGARLLLLTLPRTAPACVFDSRPALRPSAEPPGLPYHARSLSLPTGTPRSVTVVLVITHPVEKSGP